MFALFFVKMLTMSNKLDIENNVANGKDAVTVADPKDAANFFCKITFGLSYP